MWADVETSIASAVIALQQLPHVAPDSSPLGDVASRHSFEQSPTGTCGAL